MRQILWRHRCAELYRAFINDPAKSGLVGEQSHHVRHERLEERIVLSAPTIDQPVDVDNVEFNQSGLTVELTGIDNGLAGDDTLTITAASSDTTIVTTDPVVTHVPGETTATLTFDSLNVRGTATITITLNNGTDPPEMWSFDVTVPLAIDDSVSTTEDAMTSGNLLTNDNAEAGETLSVASITVEGLDPFPVDQMGMDTEIEVTGMGLLTVNMDGSYTFDPQDDFQSLNVDSMPTTITFGYEVVATDDMDMVTETETGTLSITITGLNDAPTIDLDADDSSGAVGTGYQGTYVAGEAAVPAVDSDLDISDPDQGQEFASATITLTKSGGGNLNSGELIAVESVSFPDLNVAISSTADEYVLTITHVTPGETISQADLEAILQSLTYENMATAPTAGAREIVVEIDDGLETAMATSTITVMLNSDLAIDATGTPSTVVAGETITYTITATNNGPSGATGVQVTGLIPAGTVHDSNNAAPGSFDENTGIWTIGNLASGESVNLTLTVLVDSSLADGSTVVNTGTIETTNVDIVDSDSSNNSLEESTDVTRQAELAIAISGPNAVLEEAQVTYTVTLTNNGPSDASNITVTVPVPAGTTYDDGNSMFPAGTMYDQSDWVIPSLEAGESVILTLVVDVNSGLVLGPGNELSLTATIGPFDESAAEIDLDDNASTLETNVVEFQTDVSVMVTESSDPVAPGDTINYTVTFTNEGVDVINSLRVNLDLDGDLNNVEYTTDSGTLVDLALTRWDITGLSLASGMTVTVTITGTVDDMITIDPDDPELSLTATLLRVNGDIEPDDDNTNNTGEESTNVSFENDLAVTVLTSPNPSIAGTQQTYTITVVNEGLEAVTGVVVEIPLPTGVTFVSEDSGGNYDSGTGIWTVGDLDITSVAARTATLILVVSIDADYAPATLELEATIVESNGEDPHDDENDTNDSASITTNVDHLVDVAVSMTGPSTADAGGPVTYTVTVTNDGPSQATGIVVLVDVNDTSKIESLTVQGSSNPALDPGDIVVDDAARSITFTVGTLNPGESITLTYEAEVDGDASVNDMFTITAELTGLDQADMSALDDSDSVTTTIDRTVDLSLTAVGPLTVVAGQEIVYELQLDNLGPSNANNLVVIFTLPTITNDVNNWVTIDPLVVSTGSITEQMIDDGLGGMIPTGNWLWTVPSLTADAAPATLTYTFSTNVLIKGIDNIFVDFSAVILSGQEGPLNLANDLAIFHTNVLNAAPTAENGNGQGDEDDVAETVVVDLLTLASDDQTSADPAIAGAVLNFQIVNQGTAILTDANGPHNAAGYLQGTASVVGSNLVYTYSGNIDGLRDSDVLTQEITYRAIDSAGQFTDRTVTIQITGQNDAPEIQPLTAVNTNEANVITLTGTFTDLDRALGTGEDIHVLSVTAPIGQPFVVVPGSTIIAFNAVTGKYNFSVDVIFHDDNPTGSPSDLVTLEFEIDDQIVTATGEREVTVNNLPPSIIDYEADVQLSTLGELVIPITLSDPSALDTLTLSVNRVAENDDVFEAAVANSSDPADLVVWNPSAMDPRKGELIVRYDANDFDGLSFTLRIIATDDDTGESSIIRVSATVPAGLGFLPVTPEPEDPTAPAPLPFSLPPIPESTNTISLPDNVQRALAPPAKGETVALELRIVWNYGEPDEWQEKIRELIAKDRKELQEKLQELSELLQGLPDNQYRAFLVRGDGTENQLMEVRIREGKIVDLNQQEVPSFTPGASDVSSEPTAPEQIPGEPMSRLERAFPSRISERPHDMKQTVADPFARFGRGSQIEAWQSVYRARVATAIDN